MKTKLALGVVAAAVAVFSQGAFAQSSSPTRAEVKAEAKKGSLAPAGEGPGMNPATAQPSKTSDKTRAERKATTKSDRAAGNLAPAGDAGDMKGTQPGKGSEVDRAARKADTKAAVKAGKTQPAGESPLPSGEKPLK